MEDSLQQNHKIEIGYNRSSMRNKSQKDVERVFDSSSQKITLFYPWCIALVFVLVYAYIFDSKLDLNGDNANYIHFAQNIAKGNGYALLGVDGLLPASQYPPFYSLFLVPFMLLGGGLITFKIANACLLLGALLLFYFLVRGSLNNPSVAFVSVFLAILSPALLHFASMVMSEMLFVFLTTLLFWLMHRYAQKQKEGKWYRSPYYFIIIIVGLLAYHTRVVGMAALVATIGFFLFRKEWLGAASSVLLILLGCIPWSIRNAYYGIESRYLGTIVTVNPWRPEEGSIATVGEMIEKMLHNFDETVIKGFKEVLFPFVTQYYDQSSTWGQVLVGLSVLLVIFWGLWQIRTIRWALIIYMLGQIALFMLWHGGNGSRYVVPLAPLLFVGFYSGLYDLCRRLWQRVWRRADGRQPEVGTFAPCWLLLFALLQWGSIHTQAQVAAQPYPPAYKNYFAIAQEVESQAPHSVCVSRKPELFRYYAPSVRSVNYVYSLDPEEVVADLVRKKADFVILEQLGYSSTGRYLYPAIEKYPDLFRVVWHLPNPDTYLLHFQQEEARAMLSQQNQK